MCVYCWPQYTKKVYTWGHWSGWKRHQRKYKEEAKRKKCYIKNKKEKKNKRPTRVIVIFIFLYLFLHILLTLKVNLNYSKEKKIIIAECALSSKRCWEQQKFTCSLVFPFAIRLQISWMSHRMCICINFVIFFLLSSWSLHRNLMSMFCCCCNEHFFKYF